MMLVYESPHFQIVVPERPHVTRSDGGHLIINPKVAVDDRTKLTREQAVELVKLTMVAGEAMADTSSSTPRWRSKIAPASRASRQSSS